MQNKIEQVFIKENQFLNSLNYNTFGSSNSLNLSRNLNNKNVFKDNMSYNMKPLPDDDDVRKNISQQINLVGINIFNNF
jgi:transcriptional regulator of met regulon